MKGKGKELGEVRHLLSRFTRKADRASLHQALTEQRTKAVISQAVGSKAEDQEANEP
jgi:hypothetical protein